VSPANRGAGIPDGGLCVANQLKKGQTEPLPGPLPARGAVEAKAPSADARMAAQGDQVMRHLAKHCQVLVTTFSLEVEIDSEQHERPKHDGEDRGEDRLGSA
jgi:hypothetical protein